MNKQEQHKLNLTAAVWCGLIAFFVIIAWAVSPGCTSAPVAPSAAPVASPVSEVSVAPSPVPTGDIDALAAGSACAKYSWKNRGRAPLGLIQGMARIHAKNYCQFISPDSTPAGVMGQPLGSTDKDALTHYGLTSSSGLERLRQNHTLLIGLAMRESSGNYGEGYDTSAGPESASEAEAGAWQFSYNSITADPALRSLYQAYQGGKLDCMLPVFRAGARGSHQNVIGSGAGADFQTFTKSCPAFQAEYAAVGIRVLRQHWGPLNRKEAEFYQPCDDMLAQVEQIAGCK